MPFIGQEPITGAYHVLDSITTSATATYNLQLNSGAFSPATANQLMVSLNGVIQKPGSSFTISGSQITFSSALTSSDSIDFIVALGDVLSVGTPSDGTVSTAKIAPNAVTDAKIASGISATKLTTGTLPAARLPTGTVLQVLGDMNTEEVTNSIQGFTDTGLTVTLTPSSSTNYFLVMFEGHFTSQNTTSAKGFGVNIYKDGTAVTGSPQDTSDRVYDWYQDDSANRYFIRQGKTYYAQTGTTSAVTFTVSFSGYLYSSGGDVVLGTNDETQHTLIVYEIQG